MRKRILIALLVIVLAFITYFILKPENPSAQVGNKTLFITLIDETTGEVLIDKQAYKTDALTLGEFFDENHEGISIVMIESELGRYIVAINDLDGSNSAGPWIVYESANNKVCVAQSFCPGVDELTVYDQDDFIFKLVLSFSFE